MAKGFTLLELMITLVIIGIISAIGYVNYASAQVSARDARRKQDLRSVQVALQLYYQANSYSYPSGSSNSSGSSWSITGLSPAYINQMPLDPKANNNINAFTYTSTGSFGYSYTSKDVNGNNCPSAYYMLGAVLENANDPDAGSQGKTDCNGGTISDPKVFLIRSADQ